MTKKLTPSIKWGQDKKNVYITLNFPSNSICIDTLTLSVDGTTIICRDDTSKYDFEIELYYLINNDIPIQKKICIDGNIQIILEKKNNENWKQLTKVKHSNIIIDWNKWVDDSDDDSCPPRVDVPMTVSPDKGIHQAMIDNLTTTTTTTTTTTATSASNNDDSYDNIPIKFLEVLTDTHAEAPALDIHTDKWVKYWRSKVNFNDKMLTMCKFWNISNVDERQVFLQRVVSMQEVNKQSNIKGGSEVLRSIDERHLEGSSCVLKWVGVFGGLSAEEKTSVFFSCFGELKEEEQMRVLATFS
eukprot:GHVR01042630.1.p1 GENE.GHVR01042630.1~~GHVR01042630.1.p1  ORF type:complete len:300 (+),score=73.34 GHVR01042630.1:299-1198(+)